MRKCREEIETEEDAKLLVLTAKIEKLTKNNSNNNCNSNNSDNSNESDWKYGDFRPKISQLEP